MVTKEKTEAERLWALGNAMTIDFQKFLRNTERADAVASFADPEPYLKKAKEYLDEIEDAIDRYRNDLPQKYEESAGR